MSSPCDTAGTAASRSKKLSCEAAADYPIGTHQCLASPHSALQLLLQHLITWTVLNEAFSCRDDCMLQWATSWQAVLANFFELRRKLWGRSRAFVSHDLLRSCSQNCLRTVECLTNWHIRKKVGWRSACLTLMLLEISQDFCAHEIFAATLSQLNFFQCPTNRWWVCT